MSQRKPMATEVETMCRQIVADLIAQGEAGLLDDAIYRTLMEGLMTDRASAPASSRVDGVS